MVNSLVAAMPVGLLLGALLMAPLAECCGETSTQPASENSPDADAADRDYSAELPRIPPQESERALASFEIEEGFSLELAAAEPLVADPVAMEFDEYGRLFVVEMLGYSEDADDHLGRIRLLEDEDRDGVFEKSTVFAEGLAWPTAVTCFDGGVFVGAAPDILYFKDRDGDGRADERRAVFTGFGTHNVQGLLNSFRWGLDNRVHVAVSSCGAELRRTDQPDAEPLVLRGRNFSFDPRSLEFRATSGASQHGMCFDSWGRQFTCSNSDHIQQVLFEQRHLDRNPHMRPPAIVKSIALEGPAADVFRISAVEPWREIRTRLRSKGIVPGIVEGGGRASGYFTSATGVTIYTGDAWPRDYLGNAFIGDVGSNLVHRKIIEGAPDAIPLTARRATPGNEFIASRDIWFRPVQFANGPDGNLYVLDMYREVIEHPASLPSILKKHLDLTSGRDRGRIYRVVATGVGPSRRQDLLNRQLPGEASSAELVAMLNHPNGWHRTTAARLLYERGYPAADKLQALLAPSNTLEGRLLALYALASSKALRTEDLIAALNDGEPQIRRHAARLAGETLVQTASGVDVNSVEQGLRQRTHDPDIHVRFETALALGDMHHGERTAALAALIQRDVEDEYMQAAVLSSAATGASDLLRELLRVKDFAAAPQGRAFLLELARQLGARGDYRELDAAAAALAAARAVDERLPEELLLAILRGAGSRQAAVREQLAKASQGAVDEVIETIIVRSQRLSADENEPLPVRVAAIAAISLGDFDKASPMLVEYLQSRHPQEVQTEALAALAKFTREDIAPPILDALPGMSPTVRLKATEILVSRADLAGEVLSAVSNGRISARELDPSTVQRLKTHPDKDIQRDAVALFDSAAPQRSEVIDRHRQSLELQGDIAHGQELFRKHCAICHRRDGYGTEVGADLATVVSRTPEALLISILDPNREVDPRYMQYSVLTFDGLAKSGIIASETAGSVTLKREENIAETIPRADIDELRSTGMTLMPEGFEKVIDQQGLADLIAYLRSDSSSR